MTEAELDALLNEPLAERDAGEFSVTLMLRIAREQARPARIFAWITIALLCIAVAGACVMAVSAAGRAAFGAQNIMVPCVLTLLTLLLSFTVARSAQE